VEYQSAKTLKKTERFEKKREEFNKFSFSLFCFIKKYWDVQMSIHFINVWV